MRIKVTFLGVDLLGNNAIACPSQACPQNAVLALEKKAFHNN